MSHKLLFEQLERIFASRTIENAVKSRICNNAAIREEFCSFTKGMSITGNQFLYGGSEQMCEISSGFICAVTRCVGRVFRRFICAENIRLCAINEVGGAVWLCRCL